MDPTRLNVVVTHADGTQSRWGPDAADGSDVPKGIRFGTSIPGGFKDFGCDLSRDEDDAGLDLDLFDSIDVYGQGGTVAWEGRQAEFPRRGGSDPSIAASAVGWQAHLLDDPSFREIYVDRRFDKWEEPSNDRAETRTTEYDTDVHKQNDGKSLTFTCGAKNVAGQSAIEAWYKAPAGVLISLLKYAGYDYGLSTGAAGQIDPATLYTSSDGVNLDATSYAQTLDPRTGPYTVRTNTINSPGARYLMLRAMVTAASGGAKAVNFQRQYKMLAAYGGHGLTLRTNDRSGDPPGVWGDDVIRDVIARKAPLINTDAGTIDTPGFTIPHLVFEDLISANDVILAVNGFHLNDWGVYDGRQFFWRSPTAYRRRWIARRSEGAELALAGLTAETAVNGVIVEFTDEEGEARTAGPPGSGCDYTDASLQDSSNTNPVNTHSIPQKLGLLSVKYTTSQFGAIQLGARWLAEALQTPDRGSVELFGDRVRDYLTGTYWPVWMVRAGDSIRVEDADNVERRIVDTSYEHDSLHNTVNLDNIPHALDAIQERLGVELIGNLATSS